MKGKDKEVLAYIRGYRRYRIKRAMEGVSDSDARREVEAKPRLDYSAGRGSQTGGSVQGLRYLVNYLLSSPPSPHILAGAVGAGPFSLYYTISSLPHLALYIYIFFLFYFKLPAMDIEDLKKRNNQVYPGYLLCFYISQMPNNFNRSIESFGY